MERLPNTLECFEVDTQPLIGRLSGATVHYAADTKSSRIIDALKSSGLGYHFLIEENGTILQLAPLNRRVYHAGKAVWNGQSPNRSHVGIAICNWGLLQEKDNHFITWSGRIIEPERVAFRRGQYWQDATPSQVSSMFYVLRFLVSVMGFKPSEVCTHAECAIPAGRKVDVGGSIQYSGNQLRAVLQVCPE